MKGNDSNGSYVGDNNNSFEEEMPSQPQAFHDFVFGKGNAERLWKIADEIAKSDLDYFLQRIGHHKAEPESNYNVAMYFKKILIEEENDIISNEQKKNINSGQENDIYNENVLECGIHDIYQADCNEKKDEDIFGNHNIGDLDNIGKSIFRGSWYNTIRTKYKVKNEPFTGSGAGYLLELLKCMVIVDILSMEKDNSCQDLMNANNDNFGNEIKSYLLDENNIKRRLRFFASPCENDGRTKDCSVKQFCERYLAYRLNGRILDLNDQKVLFDENKEFIYDPPDWVQQNRAAIISFMKCHIYRLMKHNELETKCNSIQLLVSGDVIGNSLRYDELMRDNGSCDITSSQLANQLKKTGEFEEYFLYAKNGISLLNLGIYFEDFCKIIADYKFKDMNKNENGVQCLHRTMGLEKFVELFIIWIEFDSDDEDELGISHQKIKKYLRTDVLNKRIGIINQYLSDDAKLKIDDVKKVICKTVSPRINTTESPSLSGNIEDKSKQSEFQENDNKDKQTKIKTKWFKNIWFWRFLSLAATVLNFILMVAFINVWFYFIVPLVIFAFITLALFCYKPASENEVKKDLKSSGDNTHNQYGSRSETEKYQNLPRTSMEQNKVID